VRYANSQCHSLRRPVRNLRQKDTRNGSPRAAARAAARSAGAQFIGTGRAADRQKALDFGAQEFIDLENDVLEDVGGR
jgi:hypothetical protein